jgi:uncharacterized protein (DUF362 family)
LAELGGIERYVRPGQTVLIKPNIVSSGPASSGGTTHVELVEALIEQVRHCSPARIIVAEGTPGFGLATDSGFPTGGWREMAARAGVELYNLDAGPHAEITLEKPRYPGAVPFPRVILDADVFISAPCLKTHIHADHTVTLKNSFGCTPQWKRSEVHSQYLLEEFLVDLNRVRRPDLIIVDGLVGAEGIAGGVGFHHPVHAQVMLAGDDPVAVDVVARELMMMTWRTRNLQWAIEDGLGIGDPQRIQVVGEAVDSCVKRRFIGAAEELQEALPGLQVHDRNACSGCRAFANTALHRFARQKLLKPLHVIVGSEGDAPQVEGTVIVVGDCAKDCSHLGAIIAGCPAPVPAIIEALQGSGAVCQRCLELGRQALAGRDTTDISYLRVSAAGDQVFVGADVERNAWHQELILGDCSASYAHAVLERAPQLGMVPDVDVLWLRGCPVSEDELGQAIERLRESEAPHVKV